METWMGNTSTIFDHDPISAIELYVYTTSLDTSTMFDHDPISAIELYVYTTSLQR